MVSDNINSQQPNTQEAQTVQVQSDKAGHEPRQVPSTMPLQGKVVWQENKHFIGTAPSGHTVEIDANKVAGASPMELVLIGLGGCASYDVVGILQKCRQGIINVSCELSAIRADTVPSIYTDIHLHFVVSGSKIKDKQVANAVALSAEKYCSASKMLSEGGAHITHSYTIIDTDLEKNKDSN